MVEALYYAMNDSVMRVKAHAAGALSNFLEKSNHEIGMNYCEKLLEKLLELSKSESSYCAGNAVICISSLAESCQEDFGPYYDVIFKEFLPIIVKPVPKEFLKFKGQMIESICISGV